MLNFEISSEIFVLRSPNLVYYFVFITTSALKVKLLDPNNQNPRLTPIALNELYASYFYLKH